MVLNVHRNHNKAYWGREKGERVGGAVMKGEYIYIYTYCYTVTTRITPALRWATMRAILMFD